MIHLPETSSIRTNEPLARHTTLQVGGPAKYFTICHNQAELFGALESARKNNMRVHVLGGGSNTIFSDEGFEGLVIKIGMRGIEFIRDDNSVKMTVAAGENWDDFVKLSINNGLSGIECLSGIPGLVGATPIQNVGAYGQEVADTIESVKAIQRDALHERVFSAEECMFSYRHSRFNDGDQDAFVITEVTFRLKRNQEPEIKYAELRNRLEMHEGYLSLTDRGRKLMAIRESVVALRKSKSMVIDESDPNSRSVGSFFKNPVLTKSEFADLVSRCLALGISVAVPSFADGEHVKVPAAWLVEHAGYAKGYRSGGVGISTNHSLAIVNIHGTATELVNFSETIRQTVKDRFGILLHREPVMVKP